MSFSHQKNLDQANRQYFDRWADRYDQGRITKWFFYTQEKTISFLDLKPGARFLDVGCGTGHLVMHLASMLPDSKICGIDISENMINNANSKIPHNLQERVEFIKAGSDDIPYPENNFDGILCTNSFHHYPDPDKALKEMKRVLKPSGSLIIFENAPDSSLYTWVWDKILRIMEKGHVRYYSSKELGEMIKTAGFTDVELCLLKNERFKYGKLFASIQIWRGCKPTI